MKSFYLESSEEKKGTFNPWGLLKGKQREVK